RNTEALNARPNRAPRGPTSRVKGSKALESSFLCRSERSDRGRTQRRVQVGAFPTGTRRGAGCSPRRSERHRQQLRFLLGPSRSAPVAANGLGQNFFDQRRTRMTVPL